MSGEIEEPFSISFQADSSIHSGSISFGRFENEALCWERRSSFSHNRYVEEVEKCLKPGSVIERKAYFEAQFKKKGFPKPNLPYCHNGTNYQACENDVLEGDSYIEEFEHGNEVSGFTQFDESPDSSEYHEDPQVSFYNPQRASSLNNDDSLVDGALEDANSEETHQPGKDCEKFSSIIDEPETDVDKNQNGGVVSVDESSNSVNLRPKTSPKLEAGKDCKHSKARFNSKSSISAESSKYPTKNSSTRQREGTHRTDREKLSSKTAISTTHSVHRTPKLEVSRDRKGKSVHESRSDKESRGKKPGEPQPPAFKPDSRERRTANRLNPRVSSSKSDTRSSGATFNFKSSERAERRKEYFMKLEEKMQAKEDEMNKIQAKKQEKTEAEIRQFRKSLNFKAAPMPSFYNVAMTSGPEASSTSSTRNEVARMKEREKHRSSESGKVGRSQKTEGKQKREMGRKGMKGVGFGSSHLTVGVAS